MSQNAATIWAAAAGASAAIVAGVIAYMAGRRTVRDQAIAQKRHWLLEQRLDAYASLLAQTGQGRERAFKAIADNTQLSA